MPSKVGAPGALGGRRHCALSWAPSQGIGRARLLDRERGLHVVAVDPVVAGDVGGERFGYMIEVQGYTDNTGDEQYNIGLSQRRAEAVERYLVSKNIPLFRVSIVGLGKDKPVADNKTRDGRFRQIKVELRGVKDASVRARDGYYAPKQ